MERLEDARCGAESRNAVPGVSHQILDSAPIHQAKDQEQKEENLDEGFPEREPATISWACELEANAKVFTGVGLSRDEALHSARSTCGSHFQASYCTGKVDCKPLL